MIVWRLVDIARRLIVRPVQHPVVLNDEGEDEDGDLHLYEHFLVVDDAEVLHHVQRVELLEPLLVKLLLCDVANDASLDPTRDLLFSEVRLLVEHFLVEVVVVFFIQFDL